LTKTDLNKLTALEYAGQLVMPRIDFNEEGYFEQAVRHVEKFHVTGFIIFNGEINQVRKTVAILQEKSKHPLFFGIDAERGLGQIVEGGTRFPFLMSQGAAYNIELVELQALNTAQEMKFCGLNLLFAPVLDINSNPLNPIINVRAFSDDAELVSRLGPAFYNKIKSEGVFACGKHFPGHGSTETDSHVELPVLKKTVDELLDLELIPFRKAIDADIDFIMIGHLATEKIDTKDVPATISKTLIADVLREKLGFKKAVITDSFRMDALREIGAEDEVAVRSLEAGCDIILDPFDSESLIEKLAEKINSDHHFSSKVKSSVARMYKLKEIIPPATEDTPDIDNSAKLVSSIAAKSVCVVNKGVLENNKAEINIFDVTKNDKNICQTFIDRLKNNGKEIISVNYISDDYDFNTKYEYDIINIVITTVSAWTKYSELTEHYQSVLNHLSDNDVNKILITFGSPYVIAELLDYNIVICSFEIIEPCQKAVADVLMGKIISDANLPIKF